MRVGSTTRGVCGEKICTEAPTSCDGFSRARELSILDLALDQIRRGDDEREDGPADGAGDGDVRDGRRRRRRAAARRGVSRRALVHRDSAVRQPLSRLRHDPVV